MWKQLSDFGKQLFSLTRDVQQNKDALKIVREERKEDRQELKELSEKVERLTELVQHLAFELQRQTDKADMERRMLRLEMENTLLRHERGLPAPHRKEDDETDAKV